MIPNDLGDPEVAEPSLKSDPRWQLIHRVADSPGFGKSPRLREFLLYVGRKSLENHPEEIREHLIGERVFDRRENYNPGEDNIVRVEARQLRKRLELFFETEGRDETLIITIPKGAYIPRFENREPVVRYSQIEATPVEMAVPDTKDGDRAPAARAEPEPVAAAIPAWRWSLRSALLLACAAICMIALAAVLTSTLRRRPQVVPAPADNRGPLWSSLFNDSISTNIICADSAWVLRQDIIGHALKLSDYLSTNWNHPGPGSSASDERALQLLPLKQYTSIGDVRIVERLLLLNHNAWRRTTVKSARQAQLRNFRDSNAVLLGSARAVPWDEIFEPQLSFRVTYDYELHSPVVINRNPRPGEADVYRNGLEGEGPGHDYSVVAYLPNLDHTGHILMIAGTTMQGMEAAGDYISDADRSSALLRKMGVAPGKPPPSFELLLNCGTMAGDPLNSRIVAYHVLKRSEE